MNAVKCNNCDFVGTDEDLILLKDESEFYKGCKNCKTDSYLMDIE